MYVWTKKAFLHPRFGYQIDRYIPSICDVDIKHRFHNTSTGNILNWSNGCHDTYGIYRSSMSMDICT